MQEYWFCDRCKSMNRANAAKCYHCQTPKAGNVFHTLVERQAGTVLTPGLDEEHRAVAWTLMARQSYVSAWKLGYVAAALLVLAIPIDVFFAALGSLSALDGRGVSGAVNDPRAVPAVALAGLAMLAVIVVHSCFLALATMDAPALGCGTPRFATPRAAVWWIESYLWALRAGLAFVLPPLIALAAFSIVGIPGLVFGIVWMVSAYVLLGDPISSLAKPRRLLEDLYERSGVPGSPDKRIVSLWALAWGASQALVYVAASILYILIIVVAIIAIVSQSVDLTFDRQFDDTIAIFLLVVGMARAVADAISYLLLARVTVEIAGRQRERENWVRSGRSGADPNAVANAGPGMDGSAPYPPQAPFPTRTPYPGPTQAPEEPGRR